MFNKLNKKEAKDRALKGDNVCIIWTNPGCPSCKFLLSQLEELEDNLKEWEIYIIEVDLNDKNLVFEPALYPTNFVFKKGERKLVAVGAAPKEDMLITFNEIREGTFKTQEELEKEQLDALEE